MKKIISQIFNARKEKFQGIDCVRIIKDERTLSGKVIGAPRMRGNMRESNSHVRR